MYPMPTVQTLAQVLRIPLLPLFTLVRGSRFSGDSPAQSSAIASLMYKTTSLSIFYISTIIPIRIRTPPPATAALWEWGNGLSFACFGDAARERSPVRIPIM